MDSSICFLNGSFVKKKDLKISADDLGFSRGYAVFEHCRTYHKKLFHLKEHLIRFYQGARSLFIPIKYSFDELSQICKEVVAANDFDEVGIKIYATPGEAQIGLTPSGEPTLLINPYPLKKEPFIGFEKGLKIKTTSHQRAFPFFKTTFYLPGMIAKQEHPSFDEILFLDEKKNILESTTSSFLAFDGKTLFYPSGNLLKSVTQEVLVHLAKKEFDVKRMEIPIGMIQNFSEVFLASSSREILPIVNIDDHYHRSLENYASSRALRQLLEEYINSSNWDDLENF